MADARIIEKDRGWDRIKELVHTSETLHVAVGVLERNDSRDDGSSNALIASVHEFGSADGHVPERSFIRSTVESNASKYHDLLRRHMAQVIEGKMRKWALLSLLGQKIAGDIKATIRKGISPPLADATVEGREKRFGTASTKPLIATGQLVQSIDYEVREGEPAGGKA